MNHLWFGKSLGEAVSHPRVHHQLLPPKLFYEEGFPKVSTYFILISNGTECSSWFSKYIWYWRFEEVSRSHSTQIILEKKLAGFTSWLVGVSGEVEGERTCISRRHIPSCQWLSLQTRRWYLRCRWPSKTWESSWILNVSYFFYNYA